MEQIILRILPLLCVVLLAAAPTFAGDPIPAPADVAAPPEDAQRTDSGLASVVLTAGSGSVHPAAWDSVEVHYTGWTTDGKMFDSSVQRGKTAKFPLNGVIAGWTEGLQLMVVGEKRRLWIPEELAYKGQAGRPAGMLVFDVEMVGIEPGIEPPKAPSDVAAVPENASRTDSGLASRVLTAGAGSVHPSATAVVTAHYSGWTSDGKMFDSSVSRGQPATFPLDRVIPGWREGLQLMVEGEKRRMWIPGDLAYAGREGAPQGTLVFDVELISFTEPPPPPPPPAVPEDVAAPPEGAETTASGIASKVLTAGTGSDHPGPTGKVTVHYSGWTTDGKMFDSSVSRGQPSSFGLNQVIAGWTEGLQLMVVGEKRRLWIPEELAYKGQPGRPAGMLVFDVELIEIN